MSKKKHIENSPEFNSLKVNQGVDQPDSINPDAVKRIKKSRKKILSLDEYVNGITAGNRTILGKAITLIESNLKKHNELADQIIEACLPYSGNSVRIGITGTPGVGKSTFLEAFGKMLTEQGKKVAVLAIDPSSSKTKGSILGDKTRMEKLSNDINAFIRPSPSAGTLGGVAKKTRETIILCEAAGYEVVFIETVGVGQSEIAVNALVDFFLLLMLAGAGDELQGIKRGIMEMADSIVITKADGENIKNAENAKAQLKNALHLFPPADSGFEPVVETCSAIQNKGMNRIWTLIEDYVRTTRQNSYFITKRRQQSAYWMHESITEKLQDLFRNTPEIKQRISEMEELVLSGKLSSFKAAELLLDIFIQNNGKSNQK